VVTPEGPEEHQIQIGASNDTEVEVKSGLTDGAEVVLNPTALHAEFEHNPSNVWIDSAVPPLH
jgi:hypothetical protein